MRRLWDRLNNLSLRAVLVLKSTPQSLVIFLYIYTTNLVGSRLFPPSKFTHANERKSRPRGEQWTTYQNAHGLSSLSAAVRPSQLSAVFPRLGIWLGMQKARFLIFGRLA